VGGADQISDGLAEIRVLDKLEREIGRLVEGIASANLGASAAIATRLQESETRLARLKAQPVV